MGATAVADKHDVLRDLEQRHLDGDKTPPTQEEISFVKVAQAKLQGLYRVRPDLKGKVVLSRYLQSLLRIEENSN